MGRGTYISCLPQSLDRRPNVREARVARKLANLFLVFVPFPFDAVAVCVAPAKLVVERSYQTVWLFSR